MTVNSEKVLRRQAMASGYVQTKNGLKFQILSQDSFRAFNARISVASEVVNGRNITYEIRGLNTQVSEFMEFAEDEAEPLTTIYGYVPVDVIIDVIEKNGGFDHWRMVF